MDNDMNDQICNAPDQPSQQDPMPQSQQPALTERDKIVASPPILLKEENTHTPDMPSQMHGLQPESPEDIPLSLRTKPKRGRKRKNEQPRKSCDDDDVVETIKGKVALAELVRMLTCSPGGQFQNGITPKQLDDYIHTTMAPDNRPAKSKNSMQVALCRETNRGRLIRLETGLYTTPAHVPHFVKKNNKNVTTANGLHEDSIKSDAIAADPEGTTSRHSSPSSISNHQTPVNENKLKRKKIRKELSVDCAGMNGHGIANTTDACDICLSQFNRVGRPEPVLKCSDCPFKGHGSCLGYNEQLSQRCLRSLWQCSDCKVCAVCLNKFKSQMKPKIGKMGNGLDLGGDENNLFFCDMCDDAYHLACLQVDQQPQDLKACWYCPVCVTTPPQPTPLPSIHNISKERNNIETCSCNIIKALPDLTEDDEVRLASVNLLDWTPEQAMQFMTSQGIPQVANVFINQELDGQALLLLTRQDVIGRLGLRLGPALKMYRRIYALQTLCAQRLNAM